MCQQVVLVAPTKTRGKKKKSRMLMKEMLTVLIENFLQVVTRAHNEGMMKEEKGKRGCQTKARNKCMEMAKRGEGTERSA